MEEDDLGSDVWDILKVLEEVESDDIDEIIYFEFNADSTCNPIGIWGYNKTNYCQLYYLFLQSF